METRRDVKLPDTAHTTRPWRIHEITPDFRLYDVWALPTPGGPDDFPRLVRQFAGGDTADNPSRLARFLFAIRWKLGALLGWDDPDSGVGARVPTLRDRLPADLSDGPTGPAFDDLPFTSVYLTDNEWAAEMANRTVQAVMHIGWVPDDTDDPGGYRGQMAVLVKPNGLLGRAYMAAVAPFRHLVVYPPLMRGIGQEWRGNTERARPSGPRSFDPVRVGNLETDAWAAYYRHEWRRFLVAAVGMVGAGFGMGRLRTLQGAWYVLRANQKWAPYPNNDPDAARELMRRFYTLVAREGDLRIEPVRAAELEVEWWRLHREHQHDEGIEERALVQALVDLYSYVYDADPESMQPAARARVEAMDLSDRWVAAGCRLEDPVLGQERRALVASYTALRAAV